MSPRDAPFFRLVLVLLVVLLPGVVLGRSWDIAVTIGQQIDFLSKNGSLTGETKIAEATALTGITYDDVSRTMFISDAKSKNVSVFKIDYSGMNFTSRSLLKKRNGSQVLGLGYDPTTKSLFWVDALAHKIKKMIVDGTPKPPVVLHDLPEKSPRDIALDICNRDIYWVNSNSSNFPSIERSNMDGSNKVVIISKNLYEPIGITVDYSTGKLYWIDDEEGIHYKIERSNLDGSDREMLFHGKHHQPAHLAVDNENIYWTDSPSRAIWKMKKSAKSGDAPVELRTYYDSNREDDPACLLTRDNVGSVDCAAVLQLQKKNIIPVAPVEESFNNLTASTEIGDSDDGKSHMCLNEGTFEKISGLCHCKPGFLGLRCEVSACHNYCLRGECFIDNKGTAKCNCSAEYNGTRCEQNVCENYCMHDGKCHIKDGKAMCECVNSSGSRCENALDLKLLCRTNCANEQKKVNDVKTSPCRCDDKNTLEHGYSDPFDCAIVVPLLSGLIGMLSIVIALLSFYVNKLRRRPRIKKRFVVNKNGITPLTSRPQMASDQCEITIENCCNMNICETPCFEPKLRSVGTRSGSSKEDKSGLLENMEGNGC